MLRNNVSKQYYKRLNATNDHGEKLVLINERNALKDELRDGIKNQLKQELLIERVKYMKKLQATSDWEEKHRLTKLLLKKEEDIYIKTRKETIGKEGNRITKKHEKRQKELSKRMKAHLKMLMKGVRKKEATHIQLLMETEEERYAKKVNATRGWQQKHKLARTHNQIQGHLAKRIKITATGGLV